MTKRILSYLLLAQASWAASYALVIGVGKYKNFPENRLDGPPNDARVVSETLIRNWSFPKENVEVLIDEKATGAQIRAALASLRDRVKAGDQVFLYFSGHGTSAFDPKSGAICSDVDSGCLIPYDMVVGTPVQILNSMIVGRRDVRPILTAIDAKQPAGVFVVFDSCFSENSAKSILSKRPTDKEIPLSSIVKSATGDDYDAAYSTLRTKTNAPVEQFPYQRVVYLSAAAKDEKAQDIPQWKLDQKEAVTLDNQPHGRMTDALLRGLRGDSDRNHDRTITYNELHQYVLTEMRGLQNPQLQASGPKIADAPLFGILKAPQDTRPKRNRDIVLVAVDASASDLRQAIAAIPSVRVVTESPDFTVAMRSGSYVLALENGLEVRRYSPVQRNELIARLSAELKARRLMDYSFPNYKGSAKLSFQPEGRGVYCGGERLSFKMSSDRVSFFLLVNIDTSGTVTVVYPSAEQAAKPAKAVNEIVAAGQVDDTVTGAEYMKLFAFPSSPSGLNGWINASFDPASPKFDELLTFVKAQESAEASLVLYSAKRSPLCGR